MTNKKKKLEYKCDTCKETKNSKAFRNDKRARSGKRKNCMVCENIEIRKRDEAKKVKKAEAKKKDMVMKQMCDISDDTSKTTINTRLSNALKAVFGDSLEHIVNELQVLIFNHATKDATKLQAINSVLDRVVGKPKAEMVIESKVVSVVINKPNLDDVIDIPKS